MRRSYGASLGHLVLMVLCLAVGGYALSRMWRQGYLLEIVALFAALLLFHDFVGWPLYTSVDQRLQRVANRRRTTLERGVPLINYVRVPAFISAVLLLVAGPMILRLSASTYLSMSGVSESPYLFHWLAVSGLLFAGSALLYGARVLRSGPRD